MPRFAANLTMLWNDVPFLDRFGEAAEAVAVDLARGEGVADGIDASEQVEATLGRGHRARGGTVEVDPGHDRHPRTPPEHDLKPQARLSAPNRPGTGSHRAPGRFGAGQEQASTGCNPLRSRRAASTVEAATASPYPVERSEA